MIALRCRSIPGNLTTRREGGWSNTGFRKYVGGGVQGNGQCYKAGLSK